MKLLFACFALSYFIPVSADTNLGTCSFPNKQSDMTIENCSSNEAITKSALRVIKFDQDGLAGGSITGKGCFWLHRSGRLKKTHCYDNGADYFKEGLVRYIDSTGKFGFMDKRLLVVIPPLYTFAYPFEAGHAKVCIGCQSKKTADGEHSSMEGGRWMILSRNGKIFKECMDGQDYQSCL